MLPESRGNFADVLDPSFRAIFDGMYAQLPQQMPSIFNVLSSTKSTEKDSAISGLSKMVETAEGEALTYEARDQGYDVTYTHDKYTLGDQITKEMWDDDQFNVIKQIPANLARSAQRTTETAGADIFNFGFTAGGGGSAAFTGGDALALFDDVHTSTSAGVAVQSNIPATTHKALTEDALEEAKVAMQNIRDAKGEKMLVQPSLIIGPPELEKEASILLKSSGRVGTTNNDINPFQDAFQFLAWPWLSSTTAWFMLDKGLHKLNWFWREKTNLDGPDYDFDTKNVRYSILGRWSVGFSDWRGAYGSKGDGSAV